MNETKIIQEKIKKSDIYDIGHRPGFGARCGVKIHFFDEFQIEEPMNGAEPRVIYNGQNIAEIEKDDFREAIDQREKKSRSEFFETDERDFHLNKAADLTKILLMHLKAQSNALNERGDVAWSPYEAENWEAMVDDAAKIIKILEEEL